MGKGSEYSFELSVTTVQRDGSELFKIEINPDAVLPDATACFQVGAEFIDLEKAKATCDEIAKRVLRRELEA